MDCEKCIDCGRCTRECLFLDKYGLNLKDYLERPDLAYNCYLCGQCKRVCPVDIDGREISLYLRKKAIENGRNLYRDGYKVLLLEKRDYLFKNYKGVEGGLAFFPGCNFPAYYPKTTQYIIDKLFEKFSIPTIFDCCGKPLYDLQALEEEGVVDRLNRRFKDHGIEELMVVCPNCYYYLKEVLDIKVSTIYEHREIMDSLISKDRMDKVEGKLFLPCPDKDERLIYKGLLEYIGDHRLEEIRNIQCCGAGGCASFREGELSKAMQESFCNYEGKIYVYCATCAGMIGKSYGEVKHVLTEFFGLDETVSKGFKTVVNMSLFSLRK